MKNGLIFQRKQDFAWKIFIGRNVKHNGHCLTNHRHLKGKICSHFSQNLLNFQMGLGFALRHTASRYIILYWILGGSVLYTLKYLIHKYTHLTIAMLSS